MRESDSAMPADPDRTVQWREVWNREFGLAALLVCVAVFLHAVDSTMVATVVPQIVKEIGGVNILAWSVMLYEMGSIVAGAASGLVALRYGIRRPMSGAAIVFAVGCAVSAMAPAMWVVLAGRVLQGFGGGCLIAVGFVFVSLHFPRRLMPRVMASVSIVWGSSAFLGPLIGGAFVEFASWRAAFWFFCAVALGLSLWIAKGGAIGDDAPPSQAGHDRFPVFRLLMLFAGVLLIGSGGVFVSPVTTPVLIALGLASLAAFLVSDGRREQTRLLPKPAVGIRTPAAAALTSIVCFTIATIAITVYGPLLITRIHDTSLFYAGYVVAASAVGWSVAAVIFSGRPEQHDARTIMIGMSLLIVSIAGFAYSVADGPVWLIMIFAFAEGAGFGMSWTFILRRVLSRSSDAESERISAAIPTTQRLGYAIGAAFVGIVANVLGLAEHSTPDEIAVIGRWMFIACLPFAAVGWIAAWRFCRFD